MAPINLCGFLHQGRGEGGGSSYVPEARTHVEGWCKGHWRLNFFTQPCLSVIHVTQELDRKYWREAMQLNSSNSVPLTITLLAKILKRRQRQRGFQNKTYCGDGDREQGDAKRLVRLLLVV